MLPEKEPQFFRPEEVPKAPEAKEEKEISLEEKTKPIREFIEKEYSKKMITGGTTPELKEEIEERKEFLLKLTPHELQKLFGEDFELIHDKIRDLKTLKREVLGDIDEKEFLQFEEEKGDQMMPWRFREVKGEFISYTVKLFYLIDDIARLKMELEAPKQRKMTQLFKERGVEDLKNLPLKEKIKKWQDYFKSEKKRPIQFRGMEKLESEWEEILGKKGKRLLKQGIEIIPRNLLSKNVKKIEYTNQTLFVDLGSGNIGAAGMAYNPKTREINILKTSELEGIEMAESFPLRMAHEFGHSLDPRIVDQKDFSLQEQFKLIKEWEEIRDKEPPFSTYVKLINSPFKLEENCDKSKEDWADSIAYYLICPFSLKERSPQRCKFIDQFFLKKFPKFKETKKEISKAVSEYNILLHYLEE